MKTAFLFSGQGAQYPSMMKDISCWSIAAKEVFDIADRTLNRSISSLCFEGTQEELNLTHNTQYCYEIASVYSGIEYEHSKSVCATTVQKDYSAAVECSPQTIDVDGTTALPLVLTIINDGKYQFKSLSSYTLTCEEDEYVTITNNNDNLTALAAGASAEKTINISVNENILDNSVIHFNLNQT